MQILVHFKKQQLERFTSLLIEANESYIKKSFQLNEDLTALLNNIQTYYQQIGDSMNESNVSQLKIYFQTALSGIDPIKLEKVKSGRRSIANIAAFHCLSELNMILGASLQIVIEILNTASETISQIILSAMQSKLLNNQDIIQSDTIEKSETLWSSLRSNEQVMLVEKKLRLELLPQDIYIIADQIFEKIKVTDDDN